MINHSDILNYIEVNYINEHNLIIRSMVNYYSLNLDSHSSHIAYQKELLSGVIELLKLLSILLSPHFKVKSNVIFKALKDIHINNN